MIEPTRKLAAIVFTDIVGFTKLTAKDQSKASALLRQQRKTFQPIVNDHKGDWVKEVGDGLILTFDTITDAVNCCIKLQNISKNIDDLILRVGIHLGEILIEENDIIGDDVNVAARIEPFSAPGGIAISNKVHDAIVREEEFETKYIGKPKLKGVGQEVKVYCITSHGLPETKLSQVTAKLEPEGFQWSFYNLTGAVLTVIGVLFWINISFLGLGYSKSDEIPSIALIPFENKGSTEDDYFSWSISTDLISELSSIGDIRVASYNDIEKIDYNNLDNTKLAKMLSIRYVAQGTLWKINDVFKLSLELFDTFKSKVLWSEKWETKDLVNIKNDISEKIFNKLKIDNTKNLKSEYIVDPAAYEYYLRAKHKFENRSGSTDIDLVQNLIQRATELDTNFIKATNFLALTYQVESENKKALELYTKNIKIAEKINAPKEKAFALMKIGVIHRNRGDFKQAFEYLDKAIEIQTKHNDIFGKSSNHHSLGKLYRANGDKQKAEDNFMESLQLSYETEDVINQIKIYLELARNPDSSKSYYYLNQAYGKSDSISNDRLKINVLYRLGSFYYGKKDYDLSLKYYQQGLNLSKAVSDEDYYNQLRFLLGSSNAFYGNKDTLNAEQYLIDAFQIAFISRKWENFDWVFSYSWNIAYNPELMAKLWNESYEHAKKSNSQELLCYTSFKKSMLFNDWINPEHIKQRIKLSSDALPIAERLGNKKLQFMILLELTTEYSTKYTFDTSTEDNRLLDKYNRKIIQLSEEMMDYDQMFTSLNWTADFLFDIGSYNEASALITTGMQKAIELNYNYHIISLKSQIAENEFFINGDIGKSETIFLECFDYKPSVYDSMGLNANLGMLSYFKDNYEKSLDYYEKAIHNYRNKKASYKMSDKFIFYYLSKHKLEQSISREEILNYFKQELKKSNPEQYISNSIFNQYALYHIFKEEDDFKKLKEDLLIKPSNLAMTESQKNNYLNTFFIKTVLNNK